MEKPLALINPSILQSGPPKRNSAANLTRLQKSEKDSADSSSHEVEKEEEGAEGEEKYEEGQEKEFNFVIKSPPKMNFIRMVHKLSRPFFNEVIELAC